MSRNRNQSWKSDTRFHYGIDRIEEVAARIPAKPFVRETLARMLGNIRKMDRWMKPEFVSAPTRLGANEEKIREAAAQILPPGSCAWIFGSILDVDRRGGDIDVYVEVEHPDLRTRGRLRNRISEIACGRKVDVIMTAPGDESAEYIRSVATQGMRIL